MKYTWPFALLGVLLSLKFWYISIPLVMAGVVIGYQIRNNFNLKFKRRGEDV